MENEILVGDCAETLKKYPEETFDCIVTDPPYGYSFMGKQWDKALPSLEALKECCRVLKPGAFAFFMSAPRQDVLSRMIIRLEEAGFQTGFTSIYWVYASGFPKASAIDKLIDKRGNENEKYSELSKELCQYLKQSRESLGLSQKDIAKYFPSKTGGLTGCVWNWENGANIPTMKQWTVLKEVLKLDNETFIQLIERAILKREEAEREVIGKKDYTVPKELYQVGLAKEGIREEALITAPATEQAKQFEGSFAGFQPKPAVEVIIVVMKPLNKKTYVDQALTNGKGVTWLGDCRIPIDNNDSVYAKNPHTHRENNRAYSDIYGEYGASSYTVPEGRFPANLLVSDNVLDRGIIDKGTKPHPLNSKTDKYEGWGSSLTKKTGVIANYGDSGDFSRYFDLDAWFKSKLPEQAQKTYPYLIVPKPAKSEKNKYIENKHPTVKPLKLMSYLITMGSREGDLILDPFAGSGTTCEAARLLNRKFVGCEMSEEYLSVLEARSQVTATRCPYRNIIEVCDTPKTIEELENSLEGEEQNSYYNLLLNVPAEHFEMVRKAYWTEKGLKA